MHAACIALGVTVALPSIYAAFTFASNFCSSEDPVDLLPPLPPPPPPRQLRQMRRSELGKCMDRLSDFEYQQGDEKSECAICLGFFEEGERCCVLPNCSHVFHRECIDRWLRRKNSCPLCRKIV